MPELPSKSASFDRGIRSVFASVGLRELQSRSVGQKRASASTPDRYKGSLVSLMLHIYHELLIQELDQKLFALQKYRHVALDY